MTVSPIFHPLGILYLPFPIDWPHPPASGLHTGLKHEQFSPLFPWPQWDKHRAWGELTKVPSGSILWEKFPSQAAHPKYAAAACGHLLWLNGGCLLLREKNAVNIQSPWEAGSKRGSADKNHLIPWSQVCLIQDFFNT